jgi:hypothetical protein
MTQKWKYREHDGRQGKFRVGDLVQVSSYALTTEQNDRLLACNHKDMVGLIVEINHQRSHKYPIKVDWINVKATRVGVTEPRPPNNFFFRELKRKRS